MSNTNIEFNLKVQELRKKVNKDANKLEKSKKALADYLINCTHVDTVECKDYMEGGYDYRATSTTWDECVICSKKFNQKTVIAGGFS